MEDTIIIETRFAGERHDIRDFVTPNSIEVLDLFDQLKQEDPYNTVTAMWQWIDDNIAYPLTRFFGQPIDYHELIAFRTLHYISQYDLWNFPYEIIARARLAKKYGKKTMGDCEDRAVTFCSVLRNQLSANSIYVALGNYQLPSGPTGHAWIQITSSVSIIDPTAAFGTIADESLYDLYALFNDQEFIEFKPLEQILGKRYEREKIRRLTRPAGIVYTGSRKVRR